MLCLSASLHFGSLYNINIDIIFCLQDDKKLWLSSSLGADELDIEMSCFLLKEIGDQFCELLLQEKQAESHHLNEGKQLFMLTLYNIIWHDFCTPYVFEGLIYDLVSIHY